MKSILKRLLLFVVGSLVLFLLWDFLSCTFRYRRFIKELPGGVIMATANKYIIKIDPAALLGKKDNDLSRSNVFLRLCGAKGGKYNTESYISGNDHEGLFCEINRYWPIQTNPILLWRGKKEREVKEVYLNMTIKEKDINRIYLIHVIPQKGIIQLIDKPD